MKCIKLVQNMENFYHKTEYFRKGNGVFKFLFADKHSEYYINYLEKKSFDDLLEDKLSDEGYTNIYRFNDSDDDGIEFEFNDSAQKLFKSHKPRKTIQSLKNLFSNNQTNNYEEPQEKFGTILDIMNSSAKSDIAVIIPISLLNTFLNVKSIEKKIENINKDSKKNIIIILGDIYEKENIEYFSDKDSDKYILKSDKFFNDIDEMSSTGRKNNNHFLPVFLALSKHVSWNFFFPNIFAKVIIEHISFHFNKVNDTFKCFSFADRKLKWNNIRTQNFFH